MIASHPAVTLAELQAPVLAGSAGAALTLVARQCGFRYRWCRDPLAHHTHTTPVPRIGGIAVFAAIVVAWAFGSRSIAIRESLSAAAILYAAVPVLLVGAFDDLRHASPQAKVLAQLAGAAILSFAHAMQAHAWPSAYQLICLAPWLVVATNSFNLVDGADGLAAGTAVIIALGLALVNLSAGNFALAMLAVIVAAACLGFLPFNLTRTRIFLGDSGSLTLGFLLAAIAFQTPTKSAVPWCALALFGYPLSETTLTVVRRMLKGRSIFRPDREHLHHKLRHARLTSAQTASVLWCVALAFASLGVIIGLDGSRIATLGAAVVLFLALANNFGYLRGRMLTLARRRFAARRSRSQECLPDIVGYLPFK